MSGEPKLPAKRGEILPSEAVELRMPAGTPLGLGFLGAARFGAIRRVIDAYERALRAKALAIDARGAVARAIVGENIALTQLDNLETIIADEESRIREEAQANRGKAQIETMRRELERMELEDQIAAHKARRAERDEAAVSAAGSPPAAPDKFSLFLGELKRMPEMVKAVREAKAQLVADGGAGTLGEADQQACEMLDVMLQAFINKTVGDTAL